MPTRSPHDADAVGLDIDYDVYDLDELNRSSARSRPHRGTSTTSRQSLGLTDPRFLIPLGVFLAALFLIFLALRSGGDDETQSETIANTQLEISELAQAVTEAELRAGFDGLVVTEQDGIVVIEGQAPDATTAASIGAVARSVEGTQRVDNRVVVQGGVVDVETQTPTVPAAGSATLSDQLAQVGNVTFETGSAEITVEGSVVIDSVSSLLSGDPGARIEVHGHTDSDGDNTQNQVLSQQRAEAVVAALIGRGIDPNRMAAVGFGESEPLQPNVTEEGRAVNRRIEFLVLR